MEIFTGHTGESHITAAHFRTLLEGLYGDGSYILPVGEQLQCVQDTSNQLTIRPGMMVHHGNLSHVDSSAGDQVTLSNGTQGMKRIDLIVNRYTLDQSSGKESCSWVCIQGTASAANPKAPAYTRGDVMDGDTVDDCPVFQVELDGINIKKITTLLEVHPGMQGKAPTALWTGTAWNGSTITLKDSIEDYNWIVLWVKATDSAKMYCIPMLSLILQSTNSNAYLTHTLDETGTVSIFKTDDANTMRLWAAGSASLVAVYGC